MLVKLDPINNKTCVTNHLHQKNNLDLSQKAALKKGSKKIFIKPFDKERGTCIKYTNQFIENFF